MRYHCNTCQDYDLCQDCFKDPKTIRGACTHDLQPIDVEPDASKERSGLSEQERITRHSHKKNGSHLRRVTLSRWIWVVMWMGIFLWQHTVIVPPEEEGGEIKAETEMGNVAVAAYNAMLVAVNAISAGAKNTDVTKAVERVADTYGVKPITPAWMHQMKRYVLNGIKEIALKEPPTEEIERGEQLAECEFEQNEVSQSMLP